MFKNNKDKEINFISTEEVEKIYEFQRKSFDAKIAEQQKKIDELTDYISARFGENVANSNLATKLEDVEKGLYEIQSNYKTSLEKTKKELKKQIESENKKIAVELNDMQTESYFKLLQKNENDLEKVQDTITENKENGKKILELDELINGHIKNYEAYKVDIQKDLNETKKKLNKVNYIGITGKFDKKIKEECSKLKIKLEETNEQIKNDVIKHSEDIANLVGNLDERLSTEIAVANEHLEETINQNNSKNEKLSKKIMNVNKKIDNISKNLVELETKSDEDISILKTKIDENLSKLRTILNESINITQTTLNENINKVDIKLDEKMVNYKNEEKVELENISLAVDIIKNTMNSNYENIEQELLKIKEETKANLEKQKSDVTDIELLKKDYNKYVMKMNNELAKISKNIISTQKKNLEANKNLQVKIKTYIDNKIAKTDNTKKIEEFINNLDISIQERENAQKLEIEELFNKKLKAIQKENERILNKKIEEINNQFIKENISYEKINPNKVTFYTEMPQRNKNAYELIDENQILRKSAKNKENLQTPQEGKSQILKFFYDEDN